MTADAGIPKAREVDHLSEARAQEIADRAAEKAIQDVFRLLGSDIRLLDDVNNLRDDFRYVKQRRAQAEFRRNETSKSILAGLIGGFVGMFLSAVTCLVTIFRHAQ